jgi:hypothetical protein
MAWTQTDIDTLKSAIARGVREVRVNGEMVQYASLKEMRQALEMMQAEVSGVSRSAVTIIYPTTSRGL